MRLALFFALSLAGISTASQVHLLSYSQTVAHVQLVLEVEVLSVTSETHTITFTNGVERTKGITQHAQVKVERVLHGSFGGVGKTCATQFHTIYPFMYDKAGNLEHHFSFQRPGSGLEGALKPKSKVLLTFFQPWPDAGKSMAYNRADSIEKRDGILKLLAARPARK